jgi:hypothetical protein
MQNSHKSINFLIMVLTCALIFALAAPALSSDEHVGHLSYFSGTVIIKSKGSWAAKPTINLPLYSSDKVVTRVGTATITFNDGAVVKIANNSNLLIKEQVEKGKGTRRLRLILGKLSFRSGISKQKRDTIFETPTGVAAIRGTAGTLSVDGDYNSYITFTEGGIAYKVGDFIDGIGPDLPSWAADMNPAQRAAFVAKAAADQAAKASAGKDDDKALCYALAAEAAATEVKIAAQIMLENNPDPEVIKAVKKALKEAEKAIDDAQTLRGELVDKGAECGPEAFTEDQPNTGVTKPTATDTDSGDIP